MNILIVNKYQGKVNRGAETFVSELSKHLSINHQVDVLRRLNFLKKYDIVIPTNGRLQAIIARIVTWLNGSKMVISGQSGVGLDDRINLYTFPDCFVALTDFALNESKKRNPFIKVAKIPNGVDLSNFKSNKPRDKSKAAKSKVILAVGAFTNEKRHDLTIKAVSKFKNVELVIAGGGGNKIKEIKILGTKLLGKKFKLVQTTQDKMPEVYKCADLFVFPTVPWESFGIVLVEAMASGLPVVATDDPIRREIVGDAGMFVDPTDTDAYAEAIEKALNTDWKDIPRKQAEKFSWDIIAKKYEELFNNL